MRIARKLVLGVAALAGAASGVVSTAIVAVVSASLAGAGLLLTAGWRGRIPRWAGAAAGVVFLMAGAVELLEWAA